MVEALKEIVDSVLRLQEINTLRVTKLEAEVMVLKNMVFKNLAKQLDADYSEVESKHESLTHVALLKLFDSVKVGVPHLSEEEVKEHLGLTD
jgi:hypothetical protein